MIETWTVETSAILTAGLKLRGRPRQIAGLQNFPLAPGTTVFYFTLAVSLEPTVLYSSATRWDKAESPRDLNFS